MSLLAANRLVALLLGIWVVLAPAVSLAPAVAMAAQPAMSDDAGPGGGDCCPDGEMERELCKLMCMNAGQTAIEPEPAAQPAFARRDRSSTVLAEMLGAPPAPDPAPPKRASLL